MLHSRGIPVPRPAADIIAALKSSSAPRGGVSRPNFNLLNQAVTELGIGMQVEDIEDGLLIFSRARDDFERTARVLAETETGLRDATWSKGDMLWRLSLLKPAGEAERKSILDTFFVFLIYI